MTMREGRCDLHGSYLTSAAVGCPSCFIIGHGGSADPEPGSAGDAKSTNDLGLPRCREALAILVELLDHRGIRLPKDHACAECVPGGPMIVAGFRCAMHEARAALAGVPPQNDQPHESLASSPPAPPADAEAEHAYLVSSARYLLLENGQEPAVRSIGERLLAEIARLREEIVVDDKLLADRQRILDALPCPAHGPCVPYVLEMLDAFHDHMAHCPPIAAKPPEVASTDAPLNPDACGGAATGEGT